jgi:hypothetical protein
MNNDINEKLAGYPSTDTFKVIDVIGVPHAYCLGANHVAFAANHCNGFLSENAIIDAEKHNIFCCICKGELSYKEHKTALLIEVNDPEHCNLVDVSNLQKYLISIKEKCENDGYVGFVFTIKE